MKQNNTKHHSNLPALWTHPESVRGWQTLMLYVWSTSSSNTRSPNVFKRLRSYRCPTKQVYQKFCMNVLKHHQESYIAHCECWSVVYCEHSLPTLGLLSPPLSVRVSIWLQRDTPHVIDMQGLPADICF